MESEVGPRKHVRVSTPGGAVVAVAGERVLIVEDNKTNMKLVPGRLAAAGYRTLEATTGAEAFELAVEHEPDLVLMDIQLPNGDCIEALRPPSASFHIRERVFDRFLERCRSPSGEVGRSVRSPCSSSPRTRS